MSGSTFVEALGNWFAAQVWSGREQRCATHLRMRGYEVFVPASRQARRSGALFPGYVFCRLSGDALGKVITTPGVIRIVGDRLRPFPIPVSEIETIQRVASTTLPTEPWPFLHAGQRVAIESGPLRGAEGLFVRTKNVDRLVVSISMLLRSVAVEIDAKWIRAASQA